ncbi:MAG: NAD(P)/FAD-dependent oxidoreductase [Pseudomonadota bacterium]
MDVAKRADVIVLGAGAAGLMAGIEAARRGRRVTILDHARTPGEKIRISGGGRCNFTNLSGADPDRYLSRNPRFALSALRRFTPADFIARVDAAGIGWHEKTLGQLFCDGSALQIVRMLTSAFAEAGGELRLGVTIGEISAGDGFTVETSSGVLRCSSLVVATGGKSIPRMGASGLGYRIAARFGLPLTETRPALVPLVFSGADLEGMRALAGVSVRARVACNGASFDEGLLFTHRGLSGPSVLQISSHWREGAALSVDLAPGQDVAAHLRSVRETSPRTTLRTALTRFLPDRLAAAAAARAGSEGQLAGQSNASLATMAAAVGAWTVTPAGSEGYRTAEVTLGGVDTAALDARTLAARVVPGLHFAGEVVDVTGWLGGYNFQWAWSSGWAAGQVV